VHDYTKELDEKQKEILYYRAIRQWSPQKIAIMRNQTDRNIRKVYNNMIHTIRQKLYMRLSPRYHKGLPLTNAQIKFVEIYEKQLGGTQKNNPAKEAENIIRRSNYSDYTYGQLANWED
jgi:hypothetical protein